jgi:hypothetical protein
MLFLDRIIITAGLAELFFVERPQAYTHSKQSDIKAKTDKNVLILKMHGRCTGNAGPPVGGKRVNRESHFLDTHRPAAWISGGIDAVT